MKSILGLTIVACLNAKQYATPWDMISDKYIEFISSTYMGNLVKDAYAAYNQIYGDN
jgi:hypothetical protein